MKIYVFIYSFDLCCSSSFYIFFFFHIDKLYIIFVPELGGINGEELSDTVCIVVRYSGGIKLGAGGLIRAYGGTARLVLRVAERDILIPTSQVTVRTRSANAGSIYTATTRFGGSVQGESYKDNGDIEAIIICETEKLDTLMEEIRDATKGDARFDMN